LADIFKNSDIWKSYKQSRESSMQMIKTVSRDLNAHYCRGAERGVPGSGPGKPVGLSRETPEGHTFG
ncbi:hypothetical protein V4Y02_23670, partial [Escherichia coli]